MRAIALSLKSHHNAQFSFEWEHDPVWITRIHIQVKRELLFQTRTHPNPLSICVKSKIAQNRSAKLKKNENNDIRESRFSIRLKYCVGYEKTSQLERGTSCGLASLSGWWGTTHVLSFSCPATRTRSKCRLQAPRDNEAVDEFYRIQPVGWFEMP